MNKSKLEDVRLRVVAYFRTKMYAEACIGRYNHTWDHLAEFMKASSEELYSREVGDAFLAKWHDGKDYKQLTSRQKERVRHIDVLSDMTDYGEVMRSHFKPKEITFAGETGKPFTLFIEEQSRLKAESSIARYKERIYNLYTFLTDSKIQLSDFTVREATTFLGILDKTKNDADRDNIVITTRVFFRYLCENKLLPENRESIWMNAFKKKIVRNKKIPSVYKYMKMAREISPELIPDDIGCHSFRHSKAMHMLEADINLVYIRDFLGHASTTTTEVYTRASGKMKEKALSKLNPGIVQEGKTSWQKNKELLGYLKSLQTEY